MKIPEDEYTGASHEAEPGDQVRFRVGSSMFVVRVNREALEVHKVEDESGDFRIRVFPRSSNVIEVD